MNANKRICFVHTKSMNSRDPQLPHFLVGSGFSELHSRQNLMRVPT